MILNFYFFLDMALSSLPDTLFTSRTANFGGTVIPEELSQQQGLASRATAYSGNWIMRIMIKIILINNNNNNNSYFCSVISVAVQWCFTTAVTKKIHSS